MSTQYVEAHNLPPRPATSHAAVVANNNSNDNNANNAPQQQETFSGGQRHQQISLSTERSQRPTTSASTSSPSFCKSITRSFDRHARSLERVEHTPIRNIFLQDLGEYDFHDFDRQVREREQRRQEMIESGEIREGRREPEVSCGTGTTGLGEALCAEQQQVETEYEREQWRNSKLDFEETQRRRAAAAASQARRVSPMQAFYLARNKLIATIRDERKADEREVKRSKVETQRHLAEHAAHIKQLRLELLDQHYKAKQRQQDNLDAVRYVNTLEFEENRRHLEDGKREGLKLKQQQAEEHQAKRRAARAQLDRHKKASCDAKHDTFLQMRHLSQDYISRARQHREQELQQLQEHSRRSQQDFMRGLNNAYNGLHNQRSGLVRQMKAEKKTNETRVEKRNATLHGRAVKLVHEVRSKSPSMMMNGRSSAAAARRGRNNVSPSNRSATPPSPLASSPSLSQRKKQRGGGGKLDAASLAAVANNGQEQHAITEVEK